MHLWWSTTDKIISIWLLKSGVIFFLWNESFIMAKDSCWDFYLSPVYRGCIELSLALFLNSYWDFYLFYVPWMYALLGRSYI